MFSRWTYLSLDEVFGCFSPSSTPLLILQQAFLKFKRLSLIFQLCFLVFNDLFLCFFASLFSQNDYYGFIIFHLFTGVACASDW
jgi:hypothetical protein